MQNSAQQNSKQTTSLLGNILKIIKFKVVVVMVFSSITGILICPPEKQNLIKACTGIIGIGLAACASAALNHLYDMHEDKKMQRTMQRPLAQNTIDANTVKYFALGSITLSTLILVVANNITCALLTIATTIGYSVLYTKWLKPTTPQNIVIGGLSGAMPPLLGWSSLMGNITVQPLLLVLIIFTWTPAHFWPLALHHQKDYAKTKWPMLPNTHGEKFTKLSIIAYALLTTATSTLPFCIHMTGYLYLTIVSLINARWLQLCYHLWINEEKAENVFKFSITYIVILFTALIVDHQL